MYLADGLSLIYNTSAELNVVEQYDTVALDGGNVLHSEQILIQNWQFFIFCVTFMSLSYQFLVSFYCHPHLVIFQSPLCNFLVTFLMENWKKNYCGDEPYNEKNGQIFATYWIYFVHNDAWRREVVHIKT